MPPPKRLLTVDSTQQDRRPPRLSPTPERLGGAICLDFANTVDGGLTASPRERLHDPDDLATWGEYTGLLTDDQAASWRRLAVDDPDAARAGFTQAIALREAIFRVFAAIADREAVPKADLAVIRDRYLEALGAARLVRHGDLFDWSWDGAEVEPLQRLLWPVARSAVDLLMTSSLERIKICASGTCRWLFVDASKNATRRWCSMADCGSRAKMRRQYARRRAASIGVAR